MLCNILLFSERELHCELLQSAPLWHADVQHFDAISDRMPLGEVKAGDVVLFDTLTAHQVIEHGQLGTSAECVRACEYPLFTSPYLHGENCLQTPTNVIKAFTLNEQPKYWSHAYTGNQIGFDARGLTPNDISTMGRKLKPLLHMTVAPKTPLSSALLNGISFFDTKKREEEEKLAAAKKREEEEKEAAVQNAKEQKEHMMKHLVLGERRTNLNEIKGKSLMLTKREKINNNKYYDLSIILSV